MSKSTTGTATAAASGSGTATGTGTGTTAATAAATDAATSPDLAAPAAVAPDPAAGYESELRCQIARALDVIGEKWSLLIVREAFRGRTRFTEFRASLGAPSDVLTNRLAKLVDTGVLEKRSYREAGSRERASYHLTEKGRGLSLVIGALVQWGDEYQPYRGGAASLVVDADEGSPLALAFVDPAGRPVPETRVTFRPGPAARETW